MRILSITVALLSGTLAIAQDNEMAEGRKLYEKECMVCHGDNSAGPQSKQEQTLQIARASLNLHGTVTDTGDAGLRDAETQIAVAPPFGPNLRGIIGRPAGSVEGFHYSAPFVKNLRGMVWDEGALDIWLTSTQKWVPGVTMYYSQKNADIRRKIIQYLKANP